MVSFNEDRMTRPQQRAMFEKDVAEFALKIKERAVQKRKEQVGRAGQQGPELPTFKEGDTEYQASSHGVAWRGVAWRGVAWK